MRISDWSSDVCSSDLGGRAIAARGRGCGRTQHPRAVRTCRRVVTSVALQGGGRAARQCRRVGRRAPAVGFGDRIALAPGARRCARSEEHTSELQSLMRHSYAGLCMKKKKRYEWTET